MLVAKKPSLACMKRTRIPL